MYDTLYAHQDKKDDSKLGLKSTALYFGDSKTALYSFAGMSTAALAASGYLHGSMGSLFYMGIGCAGSHMFWQVYTADFDSRLNLNERFVSNNHVGGIVMCSIMMGSYFS
jgi:4-hydroxybenzoate polyprenyltransferase